MFQNEFAVAGLMAIELKTRLTCEQRFQKRLALDELKGRNIPTIEMQEIESVIDGCTLRSPSVAAWVWAKVGSPASSTPQSSPSR